MPLINPQLFTVARVGLDRAAAANQVMATNIANANVPGYTAKRIAFDSEINRLSADVDVDGLSPGDVIDTGETVQLDLAVAELGQNALRYQAIARLVTKELGLLSLAMQDGRR